MNVNIAALPLNEVDNTKCIEDFEEAKRIISEYCTRGKQAKVGKAGEGGKTPTEA